MEDISGNALVIKEININLVRKTLKTKGLATKQQIAKETGLSIVTVGTVLQQLVNQKEVFESELSPSSGGRPSQQYRYNADYAHALIVFPYEIEGHIFIRSAIVNLAGQSVYQADTETKVIELKVIEEIVESLTRSYPLIKAIGFGHPGFDTNGKVIASDYKMLIGTSLTEHFSSLYQVPVILENDVNAAVMGYASRKKSSGNRIITYMYFPDKHPPGAGIIINDELFKGKSNFAGEISTIPFEINWGESLNSSFDLLCEAITKVIVAVCSILNPDTVVLNGNSLEKKHISKITQNCNTLLPQNIVPVIQLSDNFVSDYQNGLIVQTLMQLEPGIKLTKKKYLEV